MTYQIDYLGPLLSLNRERTMHWSARAAYVKDVRTQGFWLAKEAKIPHLAQARIEVQPYQMRGPLSDQGAYWPTAKGIIDGIVDAGVLDDDSPQYLLDVRMKPSEKSTRTGMRLLIFPEGGPVYVVGMDKEPR